MLVLVSINPTSGEKIKEYKEMAPEEVVDILQKSNDEFKKWRKVPFSERKKLMLKAAKILRENKDSYAKMLTLEMGKLFNDAISEVEKCAWVCEYYAENAVTILQPEIVETEATKSYVAFQPLGIILAVMPWNFPYWQVFRFAAPALMAGNVGVLKHASNVSGSALIIEEVFRKAGFPEYVFKTLLIGSKQVAAVIENDIVKAVTLTGSTPAGRAVASKAGEMLKKTVLELGGSDPYIILEDAENEGAVLACVKSRLINAGQSCIAAKRFIIVESKLESFVERFVESMKLMEMGDPFKPSTNVGPLARHDLRDELHKQVQKSIDMGAELLVGGYIPEGPGAFYPPTVLANVKKGMPAFDEELFGPVASIISVKDTEEAISIANDSVFGLGAAVFTKDIAKGERIAIEEIEAGSCFINTFVRSDPRLPFGGIKQSGYGRELSHYGIKEFVNIKTIYIK
ncbi:MAG: NAD-dependent succinate-semialdehyde dehydrogenase [Asgard group archaeon]|nr:NAD-dependent succinate-semialdehyde dehydrogenase [Asgard group archaeon]